MMTFRDQLLQLIAEAQKIHREEKLLTMRSLRVIGELELRRAAPSCGMSVEKFARHISLSKDQYLKRSAASRTLRFIPEAKPLPMRKAERAAAKHGPKGSDVGSRTNTVESNNAAVPPRAEDQPIAATRQQQETAGRYIPAAVRHQVWLRDQGQCRHMHPDGTRCHERMMRELDHIGLYCRGGEHSASNLQLKCRLHNQFAASAALGNEWYRQRLEFINAR